MFKFIICFCSLLRSCIFICALLPRYLNCQRIEKEREMLVVKENAEKERIEKEREKANKER